MGAAVSISGKDSNTAEKLADLEFTSHNIELEDGNSTMKGSSQPLIKDLTITAAIKDFMALSGIDKRREKLRLLDLGCLEGGFTLEFARYGVAEAIGVEGHQVNFDKCMAVAEHFRQDNLKFVHDDVKNLSAEKNGEFDIILCLGLLYHLDRPVEFIHTLSKMLSDNGFLFMDTHYAPRNGSEMDEFVYSDRYRDEAPVDQEFGGASYSGRWWYEYEQNTPEDEHHPWDAVSNYRSFVLEYHSLTRAMLDAGLTHIHRLPYGDIAWDAREGHRWYRTWLVAFKDQLLETR